MSFASLRRLTTFAGLVLALGAGAAPSTPAIAADDHEPLLITYGKGSGTKEGDHDFRQVIYIAVPEDHTGPLFVRLFDPDVNHTHDTQFGTWGDTRTRFGLYGGKGAFATPASRDDEQSTGGTLIAQRNFGSSRRFDNSWVTLGKITAEEGDPVGKERLFRLEVEGVSGDDGNVFDVAISHNTDKTNRASGVRVFSYLPTFRMPREGVLSEARFTVPKSARGLIVHNFDAFNAKVTYTGRFRSAELGASGQDEWRSGKVEIEPGQRGKAAAVTIEGGDEIPNDLTLFVTDAERNAVSFDLPVKAFTPNLRPQLAMSMTPLSCREIAFDASRSHDLDSKRPVTARWLFHDGGIIGRARARNTYEKPGRYPVRLEIADGSPLVGNGAAREFEAIVKAPPVARIKAEPLIAHETPVTFDGSSSSAPEGAGGIATHVWYFSDGVTLSGASVERAFDMPGEHSVRLLVRDASGHPCDTDDETFTFRVNAPPVANAGDDLTVHAGQPLRFDGTASSDPDGAIKSWSWEFGDGGASRDRSPLYAFARTGRYELKLTVTDNSGHTNATASDTAVITVVPPPNMASKPDAGPDRTVTVGETIRFDASGSRDEDGSFIAFNWDFGDGASADGITADYAFPRAGRYVVTLTAIDDSGEPNARQMDEAVITVEHRVNGTPKTHAGQDVAAAIDEPIKFDGSKSADPDGNLIAFKWNFGDGATSDLVSPTHAYSKSGTYIVSLNTTDDSGRPNATGTDQITVKINEPPVADAGPDQHVTASVVQFDGTASSDLDGAVISWKWDFGDGAKGEGPKPTHVYRKPGEYKVTLTAGDSSGTIRNTGTDTMNVVINAQPIADAGPEAVAAPGEVLVFDGSRSIDPDGEIASYSWDFRDGSTATGEVVEHAFEKPGTYFVRLTVRDDSGHDGALDIAETKIVVNAPPVADAGPDIRLAPGDTIVLNALRSFDPDGKIESYRWDFSDSDKPVLEPRNSRIYEKPGIYKVQLTVSDDSSAINATTTDEFTVRVNHTPVAEAGEDVTTSGLRVSFDGSRSTDPDGDGLTYVWDFGDGQSGAGARVTHTYAAGGTYPVVLTVSDGTGLKNASARDSLAVRINRPPLAVAGDSQNVCTGDVVVFDASKSKDPEGGVLRYAWSFGDGTKSEIVNPTKTFSKAGVFPVTLTVRDDSGLDNAAHSDRLYIRVQQAPKADAGPDILACSNQPVQFDGRKSTDLDGVINKFTWDFGDGNLGGGDRPSHSYNAPGTYQVSLTIEGDQVGRCDNTASDQLTVRVIEAPIARILAPGSVPVGVAASFDGSASTVKGGKVTNWSWDFGDGSTAEGAKIKHAFKKPGQYSVKLTIESDTAATQCRTITTEQVITVNAAPVANAGVDRTVTTGEAVMFDGSLSRDVDGALTTYAWTFGDGGTGQGVQPMHVFRKAGRYQVTLTVKDDSALPNGSHTDALTVVVKDPPQPPIKGPEVACAGEEVIWQADAAGGGTKLLWLLGDGARAATGKVTHRYQRPGRYNVTLFLDQTAQLKNSRRHLSRTLHVNQPPVAVAGPDLQVCPGDKVDFIGTASRDSDGKITAAEWDFGDGSQSTDLRTSHVFEQPGTYQVKLTVSDDSNSACRTGTDSLRVVVNAPPKAVAGGDGQAFTGGANDGYWLDGSKSSDPDGDALTYSWRIGDTQTVTGETVRHRFTRAGRTPVTLTVHDTSGLACGTASDTINIDVKSRQ